MFLDFYRLRQQPFGVTPDTAYLYPSRTHCEALDSLTEGILGDRGFLALIAEPGMGKTTLLNQVLEGLRDTARVAYLFQTQCNSREFFHYLLSELGVDSKGMGLVALHNKLNEMLFEELLAGKRFVLIVDEAQNLDDSVLETIRLLSNFETVNTKLLQIVLAGQPQLGKKLGQPHLAQLLQRITVVKHLEPLSTQETAGYIRHRLKAAGHCGEALFEPEAMALVAKRSQGVPRNINKICYCALLEAYAEGRHSVSPDIVEKAFRKLDVLAATRPMPMPLPVPTANNSAEVAGIPATPPITYDPLVKPGLPSWGLWVAALIAVLLSAGLALPRTTMVRVMMQKTRDQGTANLISTLFHRDRGSAIGDAGARFAEFLKSTGQREEADHGRQTTGGSESEERGEAVEPSLSERGMPKVTAIQASSLENDAVQYDSAHITSPDRIDSDLDKARLSPFVGQKTVPIALETSTGHESQLSLARELGLKINRIAIDPGHGGYDTGTRGLHGLLEKDLCLDVALRLGQLIEENIAGAQVVYTRNDDRHLSLEERTAIANKANADLFISIHANSSDIREARGAETYYLSLATSQKSKELATRENALGQSSLHDLPELIKKISRDDKIVESKLLAVDIQNALSQGLQVVSQRATNRGVKQAPFIVLTGAHMPAVLSEISFVSNTSDENLLLESGQRQRVAEGLYRGIAAYLDSLHSLPHKEQKLVSENRASTSSGFTTSTSGIGRNHP
jgi:N-acetylmuramoyl-L-alanine amidase/type II secretory pathway predicted ATPase ExeA